MGDSDSDKHLENNSARLRVFLHYFERNNMDYFSTLERRIKTVNALSEALDTTLTLGSNTVTQIGRE